MRLKLQNLRLFDGRQLLAAVAVVLIFCALVSGLLIRDRAEAATASTLNFQARLMNSAGGIAPDGNYNVEFKLYTAAAPDAGETPIQGACTTNPGSVADEDCVWVETRTGANTVTVANGYLTVSLGSVTAFASTIDWSKDMWLTMNIGGTGGSPTWDGEMSPRLKLTAVPYAFSASVLSKTVTGNDVSLQFASSFGQATAITLPDPVSGTATVCYQGSSSCGFATGTASSYIQNTTTVQTNANMAIQSASDSSITALFKNRATQSADIIRVVDNSDALIFNIDTYGQAHFGSTLNVNGYLGVGDPTAQTSGVAIRIYTANAADTGIEVNGDPSQTGDLLVLNAPGTRALNYTADGTLELVAGSGQTADVLNLTDATGATLATIGPSGDVLFRTATNSASALRVQKSTGTDTAFTVDTSNNRVIIGNATASAGADTTLFVLDAATTANAPTGADGGMFYDSTLNKFRCYQNGGWVDCINTAAGGVTAVGTFSGSSQTNGASISGSTITFGPADGTNPGMVSTGSQTFGGDKTFSDNVIIQGTTGLTFNTGTGGDITFANGEKIDNDTNGQINLQADSGAMTLLLSGTAGTITNSAGALTLNSFNNTLTVDSSDTTLSATGLTAINLGSSVAFSTNGVVRATFDNSNNLFLGNGATAASPNDFTISGTGSSTTGIRGGNLTLQGGDATTGTANGGDLLLNGGDGVGGAARGLVVLSTPTVSTTTADANCGATTAVDCTIASTTVNNGGSVVVGVTAVDVTITMPDPANVTAGRIFYFTASSSSTNDFTLALNSGGSLIEVAMKANSTATLVWNGTDWTVGGASSSTTLQAAYDNTLSSAGGAEIILNNTATSNGLTVRNNASNPIIGDALLEVQTSIGTSLFSVNNNISELVANGGAEVNSTFTTNWTALGTSSISRDTTAGQYATGAAGVSIAAGTTAGNGVRNNLASNPATGTTYMISFTAMLASGAPAFTDLRVDYTPTGASTGTQCIAGQTLVSTSWTRITCEIITPGTGVTNPDVLIYQVAGPGSARTFYVDNLSMTLADDAGGIPNNVQIGGGIYGGSPTLFTLDRSSAPPVANGNTTYLGSMYYDTTSGRIQCYEADGWGACGSAPNNIIVLTPEYAGAVLNGTGIGTLSADFCANSAALTVGTLCSSGISRNFYKWTSPQASMQTYSIYVSYKLPSTFKEFDSSNTITLTWLTTSANGTNGYVSYQVFKSTGSAITSCDGSTETTVSSPSANTWYTTPFNGDEIACDFNGGDNIIFKINVKAKSNDSVFVENLNFTYLNT